MLYLNKLASYVPEGRKSIPDFADALKLSQHDVNVFRTVFGLREIAVADQLGLHDLLDEVLGRAVSTDPLERKRIKYVFHCHAAPCVSPSGTQLIGALKNKHGLQHAIAVGLAQDQCATPLTALHLAEVLLHAEDDDAQVLILTGEVAFHPRFRLIPNTTIIGDATAACLVGKQGERNAVLAVAQRKFEKASVQPPIGHIPVPATSYGDDLIQVVSDALQRASLRIEDLSLILIHNVNSISWKFFSRNFPCPAELIYFDNVARMGHCFTSDPFINYCDAVRDGRLQIGQYFMMVSVGTTSTFAAVVLRH